MIKIVWFRGDSSQLNLFCDRIEMPGKCEKYGFVFQPLIPCHFNIEKFSEV